MLGLCVKLDDPKNLGWGCHSRFCPACHHGQNSRKVDRAVGRVEVLGDAIAAPFYMLTAKGEHFENISDVGAAIGSMARTNRTLWNQLLAGNRKVHGAYFAIAFSPRGRLHTHVVVHGQPNLRAVERFWTSRGFETDPSIEEARSARDVTAYALRGFVEWPAKPYHDSPEIKPHDVHPAPRMLAAIRAAIVEAADRPAFSRPYGSFCGRWRVALKRSEP